MEELLGFKLPLANQVQKDLLYDKLDISSPDDKFLPKWKQIHLRNLQEKERLEQSIVKIEKFIKNIQNKEMERRQKL